MLDLRRKEIEQGGDLKSLLAKALGGKAEDEEFKNLFDATK